MTVLTYDFDNTRYILEDAIAPGATLTIQWNTNKPLKKLWARFEFTRDGSSTVTTSQVPRFFNAFTISQAQRRYARIIQQGVGKSTFKILQSHFDARKLSEGIQTS